SRRPRASAARSPRYSCRAESADRPIPRGGGGPAGQARRHAQSLSQAPPAAPEPRTHARPGPLHAAQPSPGPGQNGGSLGGPVHLGSSPVPIGPGPLATAAHHQAAPAGPDAGAATGWIVPPAGLTAGRATAPAGAPVPPPAAPQATPAGPPQWRPWRFRMSNDVWGTPVVAGDLLYVTSFEVHALDVGTGRRQFKTRDVAWSMAVSGGLIHASDGPTLYALDAKDGAERWRLGTDAWVYSLKVDGGVVVTGTRGGGVQAWEASSGERLWEVAGAQTEFETPEAGPVIHDGTVYVWKDARLRALDARGGTERWSYPVGDGASCGGVPVRITPAPDGQLYVAAGTRVLSVDVAGGHVRWHFEAPAVFLSPPAFAPGPAVAGGGVYLVDYLGTVYALDAATGKDRWRIATESRASVEPALVAGGNVHVGSGSALYTLDAVAGTPKWRFAAGGDLIGAPVVADGRLHFGSADHVLYTLDASGGQLRWKLATGGEITGSPVAERGVVYACSKDRCVYALDAVKGTATGRGPGAGR
ncbi:outer membrane protein assembly factor BamB family protein, partial [Streptomyces sp. 8L]|uniref:outer membrane protein assembly factor BamB family protein n=1 Tax=Streptomyces sp. 8L TaxID=2877242 RepID=UPI0035A8C193